uniref:Uncharacterized protein n=1 Tax=Panagrolaimus sp. ES5 TaxID=591445 RepID=A0AC34FHE7_9BILA
MGKSKGITNFLHGNLFQIKLALNYGLYTWERTKNKENFCMANEMPGGGILDDLVVLRRDEDGTDKINVIFVQAKHSLNGKPISYSDVIKDTNASKQQFSLVEYFKSYKIIKADPVFSSYALEKCYLCSNATLNDKMKRMSLKVKDGNKFFCQGSGELRKINCKSPEISDLRNKLKKTTDFQMLAVKLLYCVIIGFNIVETNGIFSIYHLALFKEKILTENGFHSNFINNDGLSKNATQFRKRFFEMFIQTNKFTGTQSENEKETKKDLKEKPLKISSKFGKTPKLSSLDDFHEKVFAKDLYNLIVKNLNLIPGNISYNRFETGRLDADGNRVKCGKNQIDLLSQYIFVYSNNKKTIKFRDIFFEDNFPSIVDILNVPADREKIKGKLRKFKICIYKLMVNSNISYDILKQCRFVLASKYDSVFETELAQLPPNEDTSDEKIDEFFENFYFAVNQPNEKKLSELINKKLSKIYKLSDPSLVSSYLLEKYLDWFKDKKGGCWDGNDIDKMLKEGTQKLDKNGMTVPTEGYLEKLVSYGNDHKITQLKEFLNNPTQRILWLSTAEPFEIATMIPATLLSTDEQKYRMKDNYILNELSFLAYLQQQTISCYDDSQSKNKPLIIVDSNDPEPAVKSVKEFAKKISKIIKNDALSKLIIVSKENSIFAKKFKHHVVTKEKVSFNDFNKKTSTKLIQFQDEWIKLSELIKNGTHIQSTLKKELMSNKRIIIGRRIRGNSDTCIPSTYKNGNINVIELSDNASLSTILKNKAAERKEKNRSFWVAKVNRSKYFFSKTVAQQQFNPGTQHSK